MAELAALAVVLGFGLVAFCLMAPDLAAPLVRLIWEICFFVVFPIVVLVRIF